MRKRKSRGKGIIVGRTCPKIQNCPTCGRMRVYHPEGYYKCPVRKEVIEALKAFKRKNGRFWKRDLRELWMQGAEISQELQEARNVIGPSRIDRIQLD